MDIEFNSLQELYTRVKPALSAKKNELHHMGYNYMKEEDIWNYLKEKKWLKTANLSLSEIVDDILSVEYYEMEVYLKNKFNNIPREVNLSEDNN